MNLVVATLVMVTFHGPTGARIDIAEESITSIRDPQAMPEGHWGKGVRCIIVVDASGPVSVAETCDEVRQAIEGKR